MGGTTAGPAGAGLRIMAAAALLLGLFGLAAPGRAQPAGTPAPAPVTTTTAATRLAPEEARQAAAIAALAQSGRDPSRHEGLVIVVLGEAAREAGEGVPAHRALEDAKREMAIWRRMPDRVRAALAREG